MCDFDNGDGEPVRFWDETERKARKVHRCTVCHSFIQPGQKYIHHVSATADGIWPEKVCMACEPDRQAFGTAHRMLPFPGGLVDDLINCLDSRDEESERLWRPMLERIEARRKAAAA